MAMPYLPAHCRSGALAASPTIPRLVGFLSERSRASCRSEARAVSLRAMRRASRGARPGETLGHVASLGPKWISSHNSAEAEAASAEMDVVLERAACRQSVSLPALAEQ